MSAYKGLPCPAQPIRVSVRNIISHVIANAEPPSDQKEMILVALENNLISFADAFALMHIYGLRDV